MVCCRCPCRAKNSDADITETHTFEKKEWSEDDVYYFRKRMRYPWPCQSCGKHPNGDDLSYWCDGECDVVEKPYVVAAVV